MTLGPASAHASYVRTVRAVVAIKKAALSWFLTRSGGIAAAVALTVWLLLPLSATPAWSHAYLVGSTPANGEQIDEWPEHILVTLSEGVTLIDDPDAVTVVDDEGKRVDIGTGFGDAPEVLRIDLRPGVDEGIYIVSWRVISADSHPAAGSVQFGYGVPASALTEDSSAAEQDGLGLALSWGAKVLLYSGLTVGIGLPAAGVATGLLRRRPELPWLGALCAGGLLSLLGTGIQAVALVTEHSGLPERIAILLIVRGLAIIAFTATAVRWVVRRRSPWSGTVHAWTWRGHGLLLAMSGAIALGAAAALGHGGTTILLWTSTTFHIAGMAVWLGGLVIIAFVKDLNAAELRRWSVLAAACIAALLATGLVQTASTVRFPGAVATLYGAVFIIKLIFFTCALALGLCSGLAWWSHRRKGDRHPTGGPRLRRHTAVETSFAAGALVVTGLLSQLIPAEVNYRPETSVTGSAGPYDLEVTVAPARAGSQLFTLRVDPEGDDVPMAAEVKGRLSSEDVNLAGVEVSFPVRATEPALPGESPATVFHSPAVQVPAPGTYTLQLTVEGGDVQRHVGAVEYLVR